MFSGKRIRQARELRAWTQKELAQRIGLSQGAIAHIEGGFKYASRDAMAAISLQTRFPISFFSSDPPLELSLESLLFRSHAASMTRRKGVQACRYAELLYEAASFLKSHVETVMVSLPKIDEEPEIAARQTRSCLGLNRDEPVSHLVHSVETCGVLVLALPTNLEGRDAFSFWVGEQPVICISGGRPGDRLRLSVAHEVGHLVLLHHQISKPDNERDAFRFAAELLMPGEAFRRDIPNPVTLSGLAEMKAKWRVSIQAIVRQSFNLNVISERQYRYLHEQLSIRGWRTQEPSNLDIPVEKPRAMRKMAELIYGNPIDCAALAASLNLRTESAKEMIEGYADYGAEPERQTPSNVISFKRA